MKLTILSLAGGIALVVALLIQGRAAAQPPNDLVEGFRMVEVASVSDAIEQLY
jgi:hypothetical protein